MDSDDVNQDNISNAAADDDGLSNNLSNLLTNARMRFESFIDLYEQWAGWATTSLYSIGYFVIFAGLFATANKLLLKGDATNWNKSPFDGAIEALIIAGVFFVVALVLKRSYKIAIIQFIILSIITAIYYTLL